MAVADPGFDLGGGRGLCQRWGGGRKTLNVFIVEVKVIFSRVFGHISITIMLKTNRERGKI